MVGINSRLLEEGILDHAVITDPKEELTKKDVETNPHRKRYSVGRVDGENRRTS